MIAIGTMISLAYYLRVVAAVWMRPAAERRFYGAMLAIAAAARRRPSTAGEGAPLQGDPRRHPARRGGDSVLRRPPSPLVDWAANAGESIAALL